MALVVQHPAIASQSQKSQKTEMPIGDSKFLQHVAYDAQNLQMTITMKNGAQYLYFMVYPQTMELFIQAQSKGEFYARMVKGKHISTRTITKAVGKKISQKNEERRPHG